MDKLATTFIVPQLLYERIVQWLHEMIVSGKFEPGKKLNEMELQKLFGTSRAPIREAFRRMEVEGLVEIRPRKGVYVRSITFEDIQEAAEVRIALEKLAARLAIRIITPEDLEKLSGILAEMDEALQKKDIEVYTRVHYRFHRFLVDKSGNQVLPRVYSIATDPFVTQRVTNTYLKKRFKLETVSHEQLFQALLEGDASKLEQLIEAHIMPILKFSVH
jgi:DNA-binding GntR family transcriptional regulator